MPVVDRGGLLVHSLLMLNAGGDCCTDLGMLQAAGGVLGDVGSDTTFRRMIADIAKTPGSTGAVDDVMREVRTRVWAEHGWSDPGRRVILDIDATLTPDTFGEGRRQGQLQTRVRVPPGRVFR
jgi:hypothetical protein